MHKLTTAVGFGKNSNIVFAGTPEFSVPCLSKLIEDGYQVCAVYTKPDRPKGRGQKIAKSPVKEFALAHHLPIYQPETLKDPSAREQLMDLKPDLMIVVAYGLILPEAILKIPKLGCINVHASLLPRWRGAAPIQQAVLAGDEQSGITIMQMDVGLDTGDILYQKACSIERKDTSKMLHERLAVLGSLALIESLEKLINNNLKPVAQDDSQATYAHKINKEDGNLDWTEPSKLLERKIRAFNSSPVAYTHLESNVIRIWEAEILNVKVEPTTLPGTLLQISKHGIDVATGDQILRLTKLQLPGGRPLEVQDILNAHQALFEPGKRFS